MLFCFIKGCVSDLGDYVPACRVDLLGNYSSWHCGPPSFYKVPSRMLRFHGACGSLFGGGGTVREAVPVTQVRLPVLSEASVGCLGSN